ncbi:MAG: MATE family efflux transporter [Acidobacteriota bacterium]|nr:MATE family efflux transporter [Acidobacteriota bacterium]MDQ7087103.1 MATE family efflux transporter [Acidobacteriota bacterium]
MSVPGEVRPIVHLALPVAAAQLGWMLIGLVDLWMVGRLGSDALAAVSLGDLWIVATLVVAMGVVMGIDPIVSQAHGAGLGPRAGAALQHGVVIALLLTPGITAAWWLAGPALLAAGQDPILVESADSYIRAQAFSIAPFLVYIALRQYLQGRGMMLPPLVIILAANLVNVALNWVLIFGELGFPALGVRGAAIASGLTRAFMMLSLVLAIVGLRLYEGAWEGWSRQAVSPRALVEVLRHGLPVGLQIGLEIWAFTLTTLFAGWLGTRALAAHTIVLKITSFSFMAAMGISIACTTRVGNLIGAGQRSRAEKAAWTGLALATAMMTGFALTFVIFRRSLPAIFVPRGTPAAMEVIVLGAGILPIAAAFQVFDGFQAVASGVLRGMGTTRPSAVINFLGYYALALPCALWLAFERLPGGIEGLGLGLRGIWLGLALGLAAVAALLAFWLRLRGPSSLPPRPV